MIYYFSATGNSKYAALKLAHLTGDRAVNIIQLLKKGVPECGVNDVTGFVFPVYYSGLPEVVLRFAKVERIRESLGDYVYAVITCGGKDSAAADKILSKALEREVDYSVSLSMPDNYVFMYDPSGKERCMEKLRAADSALDKIAAEVAAKTCKRDSGLIGSVLSEVMYPLYNLMRRTKKFYADGNCTSCGLCASLCPDEAIRINNGKPKWVADKCQHCTACINTCPQSAIQFGKETPKRRRYNIKNILK